MARFRYSLLLLTALAMAGFGSLFVARFLRGPETGASAPGESEAAAKAGESPDAIPALPELPSPGRAPEVHREGAPDGAAPGEAPTGTGVIHLKILDDLDGTPIPDLPFTVFIERGGNRLLTRSSSDALGGAVLPGLPADTIIIEAARRPPYAATLTAAWLEEGEQEEVLLRVNRGGAVVGRLVDDVATPIPDAEVFLWSQAFPETRSALGGGPVTKTDDGGHFRVEAVSLRPRGVWVIDGLPRPKRPCGESLVFHDSRGEQMGNPHAVFVPVGEEKNIGDVVRPRPIRYLGRVIDELDRPVVGALVSTQITRYFALRTAGSSFGEWETTPGEPGFRLHGGESITDAGGRFELTASGLHLLMVHHDDRNHEFRPEQLLEGTTGEGVPGGTVEGALLQLKTTTKVTLVLPPEEVELDNRGRTRIQQLSYAARQDGLRGISGKASIFQEGTEGVAHLVFKEPVDGVRRLVIRRSGFAPAEVAVSGFQDGQRIPLKLEPLPSHRLRLSIHLHENDRERELGDWNLQLLSSVRLPEPGSEPVSRHGFRRVLRNLRTQPFELDVAVRAPAPFFICMTLKPGRKGSARVKAISLPPAGPFLPGDQTHRIELDPLPELPDLGEAPEVAPPPEELEIPEEVPTGELTLRVVDEQGQPIPEYWLGVREPRPQARDSGVNRRRNHLQAAAPPAPDGVQRFRTQEGPFSVRVLSDLELPSDWISVTVRAGQTVDLGTVTVRRRKTLRGQLRAHGGGNPPEGCQVRLSTSEIPSAYNSRMSGRSVNADGSFELVAQATSYLAVTVPAPGSWGSVWEGQRGACSLDASEWATDREMVFELPRFGPAEIRVEGIPTEFAMNSISLRLFSGTGAETPCGFRGTEPDGVQTYLAYVPLGEYRLAASDNFLFRTPEARLEVRTADALNLLQVTAD